MKKFIITVLLCTGVIANAADQSSTSSTLQFGREATEGAPQGVLPFIGAGGGYTGYDTKVQDVEGTPATIKLIGSWYLESPWVFDLGYGVNNQQFTHRSAIDTSSTEGALELAARIRTANRWQFGIIGNHFFDQGRNYAAEQADAQFAGLQVLKEFNMAPAWLARIGGRAMSETNNTGNVVMMYLVDLQIGWNPSAYKTSVKSVAAEQPAMTKEDLVTEEEVVAPARPVVQQKPAPILTDVAMGSLISGEHPINFSTSRYALTNQDKNKLAQVAKALADNKDLYERV
ncbi:MAG: OmpA family protein [Bacillota bacterium]